MRKLILLVVISAVLYGGYWFVGRSQIEDRLTEALVEANEGPYDISYESLRTRGFPSRFDTTVTDLSFNDPATGTAWTAPFFQLFALAYRPNEVIAVFPPEQMFEVGGETYTLTTSDMRASGRVRPSAALAFQNATITMDNPQITTQSGATFGMASILAAMRLAPDTTQTYNAFLEARSIALPEDLRRFLDPTNLQPPFVQNLRLDSDVETTVPIELNGAAENPPQLSTLRIKELSLNWGDMSMTAIGDVAPDQNGVLNGSMSVSARNWQQGLDLLVANGMVNADRRFLVNEIVSNLDETPHIPDTLTLTLQIADGMMTLGGFPIGPVPALR